MSSDGLFSFETGYLAGKFLNQPTKINKKVVGNRHTS